MLSWRSLPIGVKGLMVIAIPVLPLAITGLLYFQSTAAYAQANADADRAVEIRVLDRELQMLLFEAETSVRGAALGGGDELLVVHDAARQRATAVFAQIEQLTLDAEQRARLPRLGALMNERFAVLDQTIAALPSRPEPAVAGIVRRGSELTAALREHTNAMLARNGELIARRQAAAERLHRRADIIVSAGTAAGVLGGIAAALLFTTGITRRLRLATNNVGRLASGAAPLPMAPASDEIGELMDGTERTRALLVRREVELEQRMSELEGLTRELEAFSYSVSHDLRAPLRHIVGFAAMLQKSAADVLSDEQRRHVKTIVEAANRMGRLIDDLLAFSRTTRTELHQQPVDLATLIEDVKRRLMAEIDGRTVRWTVHALPRVQGDPALLQVMFENLLANAVKYTGTRDEAEIEVGSRPGEDRQAIVHVRDNGVGFDMQYEHKLFGVFQRLHSSDDFEGTGIGLATVRRIAARHGGRAWAEGRPGEGATFYVSLPTAESPS